jgi:hypothetical protein
MAETSPFNINLMKTLRTPQQVRESINNRTFLNLDKIPVIVTIPFSKRKQDLGVQFWTKKMINKGEVVNSDNTVSRFVELY